MPSTLRTAAALRQSCRPLKCNFLRCYSLIVPKAQDTTRNSPQLPQARLASSRPTTPQLSPTLAAATADPGAPTPNGSSAPHSVKSPQPPLPVAAPRKTSVMDVVKIRRRGKRKITMVTAYDYPSAVHVCRAGIDILLVGDSVGMVELGYDTTQPVTVDEMLHHCQVNQCDFMIGR